MHGLRRTCLRSQQQWGIVDLGGHRPVVGQSTVIVIGSGLILAVWQDLDWNGHCMQQHMQKEKAFTPKHFAWQTLGNRTNMQFQTNGRVEFLRALSSQSGVSV